jgi:type I restriction enzyme M protein
MSTDTTSPPQLVATGRIEDYVSGTLVRSTPEEADAVQVFARRLVEDYGYAKKRIRTHPQFRVRARPSDRDRSYPVDIAVFRAGRATEQDLFMIVECKARSENDGLQQLKLYLDMSPAEIGVWFNGDEHIYLRKVLHQDGTRTFEQLPNIPRAGQRIADIGRFARRDLREPSNLKAIFRDIRNHLAGHVTGITRDEALAQEIVNLLFCKIYDEMHTSRDDIVTFRSGLGEEPAVVRERVESLFALVKAEYDDVFAPRDTIALDANSLVYVVGELQNYSITEADRDAVGEAFEVFIGPALRGAEGQFFTPRNVVRMLISILNPQPGERIIDPACGSGGFLIMALEHVWRQVEAEGAEKGWSAVQVDRKKRNVSSRYFRGIDKDSFLSKVTKAYMAIIGDGRGGVSCDNSLLPPARWEAATRASVELGAFDVVLTNPPFGSKIRITGTETLGQYDLARKWKRQRKTGELEETEDLRADQAPQILFLERCLQLLKDGGRLGIILPESILGNPSYEYVIAWLLGCTRLLAVITLPEPLFKTSGKSGTHTKVAALVLQKTASGDDAYDFFMGNAKWCGHDSRGNPTVREFPDGTTHLLDDVPEIARRYAKIVASDNGAVDHLGFAVRTTALLNRILVPKYYDPELSAQIERLTTTHDLRSIGGLVDDGVLSISTGVEVGKMAYGTGPIPFIRTSDISNWELKADPKQGVSFELYERLKHKAEARPGDILLVRDGTYLIGTCALLTSYDGRLLFQSHIYRLRVLQPDELDPALLFACLNAPIVKRQIRAKQFTQDIIDTLGNRILELRLPIPRDPERRARVAAETRENVETRAALRNRAVQIAVDVEGEEMLDDEDRAMLDQL